MTFNLLSLENLLDINEHIKIRASNDRRIEYTGSEDYPIKIYHLEKLIEYAPENQNIVEFAAYYLKNIILLQTFPDGNHRTALTATEMFLEKNGFYFDYTATEASEFQKKFYKIRLREYGTYEERPVSVLKEVENQAFSFCLTFIKMHIKR